MSAPAVERYAGSVDHLSRMSASKAGTVMGYANPRWDSPKALFLAMTDPERHFDEKSSSSATRGTFLESGLIARWFHEHPEATDRHGGEKRYDRIVEGFPFVANPDDECVIDLANLPRDWRPLPDGGRPGLEAMRVGIECKTVGGHAPDLFEWGEPGTDVIPAKYLIQVQFQQFMSGVRRTAVIKGGPYIDDFDTYWVDYNPALAAKIIERCVDFMQCVELGIAPPNDGAPVTFEAVRRHNPDILRDTLGEDWPVNFDLALEYSDAVQSFDAAESRLGKAKCDMFEAMGKARRAVVDLPPELGKNGKPKKAKQLVIATRQGVKGGGVTLVKPRKPIDLGMLRDLAAASRETAA